MKQYSNKDITVIWQPEKCIHSEVCIRSLPEVFRKDGSPWIDIDGASAERIRNTIDNCPSGALSYKRDEPQQEDNAGYAEIRLCKDGPLMFNGKFRIVNHDGTETVREGKFTLCRCGHSSNKPFCDSSHKSKNFSAP